MTTMNMPGFTAEASLYKGKARYAGRYRQQARGEQWGEPQRTIVIPQLGGPGFEGLANCLTDCADAHPAWTAARCRASCRDPGGTSPGGSSVGYGPSCEASPPSECGVWFSVCCPLGGLFGCPTVCSELLHTCLENSRRECLIARHGPLSGGSSYPRSGVVLRYALALR